MLLNGLFETNHFIFCISPTKRKASFSETLNTLFSPPVMKPFTILVIYFMLYQFSGVNTITFYAVDVFKISGASWDANTLAIGMGILRLIFTIVGSIAMRRCGRRPLTFVSSTYDLSDFHFTFLELFALFAHHFTRTGIGCGFSMLGFGLYLLYKSKLDATATPQHQWFPVTCIFIFTICCTIGYLIVPWVMIGELYPLKVCELI